MNKNVIVSVVSLFAAGVAFAAYQNGSFGPQYAEVIRSAPITVKQDIYADVVNIDPVTKTVSGTREVCEDRLVEGRRAERFGNKDGTIIGAVVGGLLGNQVGGGNGKKLATVAGAVGGGFAGREIDSRHVGGKRYSENQRVCRTEDTSKLKTIGYDVQYITQDGKTHTRREDNKPGDRLWLGQKNVIAGYDVAWRYRDKTGNLHMDEKPGERLRIEDGVILLGTTTAETVRR